MTLALVGEKIDRNRFTGEKVENSTFCTPYGGFVPTVKIATNSELAAKKKHWIDFDAGQLLHGKTM
ncbi:hypothetical protein CMV56_25775, partial [Klebsiella pneumoniae]